MTTQKQVNLFAEEILAPVAAAAGGFPAKCLTGFLAMRGHLYNRELMVIGRAVNGWRCCARPQDLAVSSFREEFAVNVLKSVTGDQGQCPMKWVTNRWGVGNRYNTKKSAFWRVIRRVTDQLQVANRHHPDWSSYIVWSNLYKLSPCRGRNPSRKLRHIQLAGCKNLVQLEIKEYRPKRLLILTGRHWATPFLDALRAETLRGPNGYVRCIGRLPLPDGDQTHFVVACHPERKPETPWTTEVLQAFQALDTMAP